MKKKLALSAVSVLLTLLVAEAALRILGVGAAGRGSAWFAGGNHPRFLFQPDAESGYTLRPGFQGREIAPGNEFDVPAVIDARGLRDQPHTEPPRPCILAVGDSMTFGEGVPADRSYSAVLEKTAGIRVYNGGVPGYSSRQMLVRLRRLAPGLRPDVVVFTLSPHWDRQRCATPFLYKDGYIVGQGYADRLLLLNGNLYLKDTRLPVLGSVTAQAKRYSVLMRLALPALAGGVRSLTHRPQPDNPKAQDYEPTVQSLDQARRFAQTMNARFLAVLIDDRGEEFHRDRLAIQKRLQDLGIPYVAADGLIPGDWKPLRFARDGHWNAAGHEAMGRTLAAALRNPAL